MYNINYEVTYVSKSNHKFLFQSSAKTEMKAISDGMEKIQEKGYDVYQYVFDDIRKVQKLI